MSSYCVLKAVCILFLIKLWWPISEQNIANMEHIVLNLEVNCLHTSKLGTLLILNKIVQISKTISTSLPHPLTEGHWKFCREGWGVSKGKVFKRNYNTLIFQRGWWVQIKINSSVRGVGMDVFWKIIMQSATKWFQIIIFPKGHSKSRAEDADFLRYSQEEYIK